MTTIPADLPTPLRPNAGNRYLWRAFRRLRPYWKLTASAYLALLASSAIILATPQFIRWIVDRGVKVVGIDYLSIEPMDSKRFDTHRVILGNRLAIAEGLDLANIIPGHYNLFCLPLKIARGDGAPARVILVEDL